MPIVLSALASLGGLATFIGAIIVVVRSIFAQINATKDNTDAVKKLTERIEHMDGKVTLQGERIATLEGWRRNGAK